MSRPAAYKGNDPYIFVSYCHKDDARVWPMIEGLQKRGMRVWYDAGIEWGNHWDEVIFEHLSGCACVVAFVTENFLQSENCMDEISYAKDEKKGPFLIFLDDLELTGMMKYRYGRIQALNLHQFASADALLDNLVDTQILSACCSTAPQPAAQRTTPAAKPAPQQTVPVYQPSRPSDADLEEWTLKGNEYYDRREYVEAVKWYRKAVEQGYARAQANLGVCYYFGRGVDKDQAEAVKWFRKAAEQGFGAAQYKLGICYENGEGTAKDDKEAVRWYRKAAEQGNMWGAFYLADCYAHGRGVPKDKTQALKWFQAADEHGHPRAKEQIKQLSWY